VVLCFGVYRPAVAPCYVWRDYPKRVAVWINRASAFAEAIAFAGLSRGAQVQKLDCMRKPDRESSGAPEEPYRKSRLAGRASFHTCRTQVWPVHFIRASECGIRPDLDIPKMLSWRSRSPRAVSLREIKRKSYEAGSHPTTEL
jgi:hypothetical protein